MIPEADEVKGTFYAWVYARISIESASECLCAPYVYLVRKGTPKSVFLSVVKKNQGRHSDRNMDLPEGVEEKFRTEMECLNGEEALKLNRTRYGFGGTGMDGE